MQLQVFSNVNLRDRFNNPNEEAKPWTYWYWLHGAVSKEGITADLEAMKDIGLGGAYLMPIYGKNTGPKFDGKIQQLTPEFWEYVNYSIEEAYRLGLKLGMHICDGFALAGGPWISPSESMQKIVWADTIVNGGSINNLKLPIPESYKGYYEDILTFVIPADDYYNVKSETPKVSVGFYSRHTNNNLEKTKVYMPWIDDVNVKKTKALIETSDPCWILYEYPDTITCTNVEIILNGNCHQAHRLNIFASNDGNKFWHVKQLVPARNGWQNLLYQSTHSIPETTAKYFKFEWNPEGSEPGSEDLDDAKWIQTLKVQNIVLHSSPKIHQWEGKAGFVWRVADRTSNKELEDEQCLQLNDIYTTKLEDGRLNISLPKGKWKVIRIGHTSTGITNATGGGGRGLECNKFDRAIIKKQIDNWFAQAFKNTNKKVAKHVLKYMHIDSWECGSQNWSDNFPLEFKKRRGYDMMPYLLLFTGTPMISVDFSETFLRDVRTTINELINDVFYKTLAESADEFDCLLTAESIAPIMVSDGMEHYKYSDNTMGEFWLNSPTHDKPNDMMDAISGAHIYGKKIIQAEGFTQLNGIWDEDPAMVKPLLDKNYALGMNKLFFHVFTHNPWMNRKPGMTLDGVGLFFQRDQTWWNEGKAFVDYISRCQSLLQYGHPVVDIAVFTGEEMPRRSFLPDRLISFLPGVFGHDMVKYERERMLNIGQPIAECPIGLFYSKNMFDISNYDNHINGYIYDSLNKDAILNYAKLVDGKIVMPGGVSYSILVLPGKNRLNPDDIPLSDEVKSKFQEWNKKGLIIPELPYGKSDFSQYGIEKDLIVPSKISFTHRSGSDYEIYFLSNQDSLSRSINASFRVYGMTPEIWNPLTGDMYIPKKWKCSNSRTEIELNFPSYGSLFVVFPKSKPNDIGVEKSKIDSKVLDVDDWNILFPKVNKTLSRSNLFDWSDEQDNKIKYYSGRVYYETSFTFNNAKKNDIVKLNLGDVNNLATVYVNDIFCGIAWTYPYEVDVTKAIKNGKNNLKINVVNTWSNAILGADKGNPPFEGIWTNAEFRVRDNKVLPAGLIGPVRIENYR